MKIGNPIHRKYLLRRKSCWVNQLMGENKNRLFYGPEGHRGIDLRTRGKYVWDGNGNRSERTAEEKVGFIWLVAMIAGTVTTNVFTRDRHKGWGIFVTSAWVDGVQYKTMQWHIETPWSTLKSYTLLSDIKLFFKRAATNIRRKKVGRGYIIAIGGNSGFPQYSDGPHVHIEFYKREIGTPWMRLDPMKHFNDDIIYEGYKDGKMIRHKNGVQL